MREQMKGRLNTIQLKPDYQELAEELATQLHILKLREHYQFATASKCNKATEQESKCTILFLSLAIFMPAFLSPIKTTMKGGSQK